VCVRWRNSYKNFLEDMGSRPVGTTIERLDNNGNYEPSNCKWATYLEQNRNRRNTRLVTYKGVSLKLSEWAKLVDIPHTTLKDRYYRGWQVDQLLTKPKGR
jgi:hypothetical protein